MALNYAKGKPVGNNAQVFSDSPPPASTLAIYSKENATASSVVTLTQDTTAVEVSAVGAAGFIRWVSIADGTTASTSVISAASGANFDHVVSAGATRYFIVPIESAGADQTSIQGANRANGLYRRLAFKTAGVGSILAVEK